MLLSTRTQNLYYALPLYALGTNCPRDIGGYGEKLYVTLRCQFPGKSVPDGLQERPILGPLGLFVCGIDVPLFLFFIPCSMPF